MNSKLNYSDLSDEKLKDWHQKHQPKGLEHGYYKTKGFIFPDKYKVIEQSIEELEVFDTDVWITSFPKSGTTWLSEMVWSICNDLNSAESKTPLDERVRFLEYSCLFDFEDPIETLNDSVKKVEEMPHPRFIKTHLPWDLLPGQIRNFTKRPKIIHIMRNPKDVVVSFYHHFKLFRGYFGDSALFQEIFLRDLLFWTPYKDNIRSYCNKNDEPNVLILEYEEMKADMRLAIIKIAKFLNIDLSQEKLCQLLKHLTFENMKQNKNLKIDELAVLFQDKFGFTSNESFFRKGEIGAYKSEMDASMQKRFDDWLK